MSKLSDLKIAVFCSKAQVTCKPDNTMAEVSKEMEKFSIHHVPIVDGNKTLGVVSNSWIRLLAGTTNGMDILAKDIMNKNFKSFTANDSLDSVINFFRDNSQHATVIDLGDGGIGIFTTYDLIKVIDALS